MILSNNEMTALQAQALEEFRAIVRKHCAERGCTEMPGESWDDFVQRYWDTRPDNIELQREIARTRAYFASHATVRPAFASFRASVVDFLRWI